MEGRGFTEFVKCCTSCFISSRLCVPRARKTLRLRDDAAGDFAGFPINFQYFPYVEGSRMPGASVFPLPWSAIDGKGILPSRNALTAISSAAFNVQVAEPPVSWAW